jgi:putative protein kinase ArgK-like GTPase of G3E family
MIIKRNLSLVDQKKDEATDEVESRALELKDRTTEALVIGLVGAVGAGATTTAETLARLLIDPVC